MGDPGDTRRNRPRAGAVRRTGLLLALICAGVVALAQDDPGSFEVRSANSGLSGGVYYLNARIALRLSSEARAALESGLPLTIRLEIEVLTWRRLWVDTEAARLTQLYELRYHALTQRYMVRNLNSGAQSGFGSLAAALVYLGRIEELPIIDRALLENDRRYDIRIRALLDTEQLPGPLRLIAFWRRDWSLGSDWYRWQLQSG